MLIDTVGLHLRIAGLEQGAMYEDSRGLAVTAATQDAVVAFEHAIDGYLGLAADTGERLKAIFALDPQMPMAHALKGYFFMLMAMPALKSKAQGIAAEIADSVADATPRERQHCRAMDAWAHGRSDEALALWQDILLSHPRDILAMRLSHHGHFYRGDGQNLRDGVARTLHAWDENVPGYGFVMGMRAFGLEETHAYEAATAAGEQAVAINPNDPWAIHAVAHVHEMTDQPETGITWITANEAGWTGANNFRYHLWWHRALMHLDLGDYDQVLALYDKTLWDADSDEYLDLCNDAALLQRLELHGLDVGDRWQALGAKCQKRTSDHILAFIDAHFVLALAAAGMTEADDLQSSLADYAGAGEDNSAVTRAIGIPLAAAVVAYRKGNFDQVVEALMPIRYDLPRMGGSHAQRDLFAMILLDAAIRAGRVVEARSLAAERAGRMPANAWSAAAYERAMAL